MIDVESLWKTYHKRLHSFILSRIKDESNVEDLLQDVFVRTQDRIHTLRDDQKIEPWLYRIARNVIIDHYRSRSRPKTQQDLWPTSEIHETDKARKEIAECIRPMIERLPEPYRQAVILSEIDGLTQKEVAGRQGLSLSGAKSRVQRGRAMLKNMLLSCCRLEFDHNGCLIDYEQRGKRRRIC